MNEFDTTVTNNGEDAEPGGYRGESFSIHHRPSDASIDERLAELEIENSRLHRLVAELLIKNQQLRKPDSVPRS
jgi:hypothetical protein